ncbi:MAG: hypothetical protein KAS90_05960 [Candidatus Aenigmarchaeota archaeon]|nr:hypothetical protein [Candidatus Aenigmarchaeota archaeon]
MGFVEMDVVEKYTSEPQTSLNFLGDYAIKYSDVLGTGLALLLLYTTTY